MISNEIKDNLKERFKNLIEPVEIILDKDNSKLSEDIKNLLKEISTLSDKISFAEDNLDCFVKPCFSINSSKDYGIRYSGLPVGGEFQNFIDTIVMVSKNEYNLTERTVEILEMLDNIVKIKVFITKSCGWCPLMLKKLYSFALVSDYIYVYGIDCHDFPDLAIKYNVSTVPKIVINDKVEFVGYKEENDILGYIISAAGR